MAKRAYGSTMLATVLLPAAVLLLAAHPACFAQDGLGQPQPHFSLLEPAVEIEARLFSLHLNAAGMVLTGSLGYARQPYEGDPGEARAYLRLVVPLRRARPDWGFRLRQWRNP